MASRRFLVARRYKFINTSAELEAKATLKIKPTTTLTLHPTTDLVASPEGEFISRVDFDMNNKNLLNAPNVMTRKKITVDYSDFTTASHGAAIKLMLASMGDTILDITAKLATPFKYDVGPATVLGSIYKVAIGDLTASHGFKRINLCGSSVTTPSILFAGSYGTYLWKVASTLRMHKTYTANASIEANFNASGGFYLASLTQGTMHFYVDMIKAPS